MQEEIERRVAEIQKQVDKLKEQLAQADQEVFSMKEKMRLNEKKLESALAEAAEAARKQQAILDQLRQENGKLSRDLADTKERYDNLKVEHREAQESWNKERTEHEKEQARLQATVNDLHNQLQEAIVNTKFMKEAMVSSGIGGGKTKVVSPKLEELVRQLEHMRDQLGLLKKERDREKDLSESLMLKLDKNRRRLELERQFLPLIRHAKGPLGPKESKSKDALTAPPIRKSLEWDMEAPDSETLHGAKGRMQRSQSFANPPRGHALC